MGKFEAIFQDLRNNYLRERDSVNSFSKKLFTSVWLGAESATPSSIAPTKEYLENKVKDVERDFGFQNQKPEKLVNREDLTEKQEVIQNLEKFVLKETETLEEPKISFPGGEIESKHPGKEINIGESQAIFEREVSCLFVTDFPKGEDGLLKEDSNELFEKMVSAMGLGQSGHELVAICENSETSEDLAFTRFLDNVAKFKPKYVLSMGALPTKILLGRRDRLTKVRGTVFNRVINKDNENTHQFKVLPIFHPDFLLINPKMKSTTWEDLQLVMRGLQEDTE